MQGFTGKYHNGKPMFIRKEYLSTNGRYNEYNRVRRAGYNVNNKDYSTFINSLLRADPTLVYRVHSIRHDQSLQRAVKWELWEKVPKLGYVHNITGELCVSGYPHFDSYPFWCAEEPGPLMTESEYNRNMLKGIFGLIAIGIIAFTPNVNYPDKLMSMFENDSDDFDDFDW